MWPFCISFLSQQTPSKTILKRRNPQMKKSSHWRIYFWLLGLWWLCCLLASLRAIRITMTMRYRMLRLRLWRETLWFREIAKVQHSRKRTKKEQGMPISWLRLCTSILPFRGLQLEFRVTLVIFWALLSQLQFISGQMLFLWASTIVRTISIANWPSDS